MFPLTRVPFWYRFFEPQPNLGVMTTFSRGYGDSGYVWVRGTPNNWLRLSLWFPQPTLKRVPSKKIRPVGYVIFFCGYPFVCCFQWKPIGEPFAFGVFFLTPQLVVCGFDSVLAERKWEAAT